MTTTSSSSSMIATSQQLDLSSPIIWQERLFQAQFQQMKQQQTTVVVDNASTPSSSSSSPSSAVSSSASIDLVARLADYFYASSIVPSYRFIPLYLVYLHFRTRGYVITDGARIGVDYVVYPTGGPEKYHAQ